MKKINELTGFRDPNACEKEFIGQYFEKIFQHQIKTCKGLRIILCVIGIFCVSACSVRNFENVMYGPAGRTAGRNAPFAGICG